MSTTTTWETGTNDYARHQGFTIGHVAARDLRVGDSIRVRLAGEDVMTTLPITEVRGEERDVVYVVGGERKRTSRDIRVAVF